MPGWWMSTTEINTNMYIKHELLPNRSSPLNDWHSYFHVYLWDKCCGDTYLWPICLSMIKINGDFLTIFKWIKKSVIIPSFTCKYTMLSICFFKLLKVMFFPLHVTASHHHLLSVPTGQQWNPLQGENDNTSEEAEGVLQPETGMVKVGWSWRTQVGLSAINKAFKSKRTHKIVNHTPAPFSSLFSLIAPEASFSDQCVSSRVSQRAL